MDRLSSDFLRDFFAEDTILSGLSSESLGRVVSIARQTLVRREEHLFLMGQPCEALHFMALGAALLVRTSPEGRQRVLHRVIAGDMVGAVSFFDGKGYPATFTAETDSLVISLPRAELLALIRSDGELALSIVGGVVRRLRLMVELVDQMSFEDTTHRLWGYLVKGSVPASTDGSEFPRVFESLPTRERIAESIGTVREVVSRRLSALVESRHVVLESRRLTLLRPFE